MRRVIRDGDASYLLNRVAVRRLDVQEALADAGLGRELHAIVSQGKVEEILLSSAAQRRQKQHALPLRLIDAQAMRANGGPHQAGRLVQTSGRERAARIGHRHQFGSAVHRMYIHVVPSHVTPLARRPLAEYINSQGYRP